jgi:putative transposase
VISAELAGETIPLRDLVRVRNQRRKELRSILLDRQKMVDTLLLLKKGPTTKEPDASTTPSQSSSPVKRYRNE